MTYLFHALRRHTIFQSGMLLAILLTGLWSAGPLAAQQAYQLNPGDRIAVQVVAWDTIELDFVEYGALSREYGIGPDGMVMIPLLGAVLAQGKSAEVLAEETAVQLQVRLGLAEPPSVSITILGYRPIYVLGAVRVPGTYGFSPGLTVQQALALAGGVENFLETGPDRLSSVIRTTGTLREIRIDMARQEIRAARLKAEMQGLADFAIPDGIDHPDGPAAVSAIFDNERILFLSRREARDRALVALNDNRRLLETEIAALEGKQTGQNRQAVLLREQVGNVETLVGNRLVRSSDSIAEQSQLIAAQNQLIELENRQLDTETAVFRARQSIGELERDRVDIEANWRLAVLRELLEAEAGIERLSSQRTTTGQLLVGAESLLADSDDVPTFQLQFKITRDGAAGRSELEAGPETRLQPADVLEVEAVPGEDGE